MPAQTRCGLGFTSLLGLMLFSSGCAYFPVQKHMPINQLDGSGELASATAITNAILGISASVVATDVELPAKAIATPVECTR